MLSVNYHHIIQYTTLRLRIYSSLASHRLILLSSVLVDNQQEFGNKYLKPGGGLGQRLSNLPIGDRSFWRISALNFEIAMLGKLPLDYRLADSSQLGFWPL